MKISKETLAILNEEGYVDVTDYLQSLSEDFCIEVETVEALAELLGEGELFDCLLSSLEDITD